MSLTGYNPYTYTRGFRNQEFHHAVLSVSGTWHTLYLDGVQVAQNLSGGNIFASYQTITNTVIGAQTTLSQAFQGTIGDVRVYNYAIQQPLVTSLYRDRNLVVYYPFDTSVNALTPNYATLIYDASLIGQPLITASAGANVGSGALTLTNSAGAVATQYVKTTPGIAGQVGWNLNAASGITIACWINVAGVAGRIQRIFDIPLSVGTKGLAVDISGTNMLYSGWNVPQILTSAYVYLPLTANTLNIGTSGVSVTVNGSVPIGTYVGKTTAYFNNAATTSTSNPGNASKGNNLSISFLSNIQDFSFGYWLYVIDNGCYSVIRGKTSGNADSFDNLINFNTLYIGLNVFATGGSPSYNINLVGGWNHIFYTVKQSASPYTVTLYVNGSSVTSATGLGDKIINTLLIGGADRGFNGYIRQFVAFNYILTPTDVTNIYNATI